MPVTALVVHVGWRKTQDQITMDHVKDGVYKYTTMDWTTADQIAMVESRGKRTVKHKTSNIHGNIADNIAGSSWLYLADHNISQSVCQWYDTIVSKFAVFPLKVYVYFAVRFCLKSQSFIISPN